MLLVPEYVTNVLPRYLPNLTDLELSKQFSKEVDGHVVSMLMPPHAYKHDAQAAEQLEEELCTVFDMPKNMFPQHAPLNKITFMPPQLLPPAFEAGGVFAPGVLARKFYPAGLLSSGHKGPTPALFVGRRIAVKPKIKRSRYEHLLPYMCTEYTGLRVKQLHKQLGSDESGDDDDDENTEDEEDEDEKLDQEEEERERKVNGEGRLVKLGYIIAHANTMDKVSLFANQPVQYHSYVPDLSTVQIMVYSESKFVLTVLSDVVHPHEPEVAQSVKDVNDAIIFPLPTRNFYDKGLDGPMKRAPVYLPPRFLPEQFEAGCVFGPGTLPESLFMRLLSRAPPQMQHNKGILPPLFLGLWKNHCTPADCIFPKKTYLINVTKSRGREMLNEMQTGNDANEPLDEQNSPDRQQVENDNEQPVEEQEEDEDDDDEDEEDEDEEEENEDDIDTEVFDDGDGDDEEEQEQEQGLYSHNLDHTLLKAPGMEEDDTYNTTDASEDLEEYYGNMLNSFGNNSEPPRVPPLPELPPQLHNVQPPQPRSQSRSHSHLQSQPQVDSAPLVRDPRLWFFELSGHPEEIEQSLHRVKNAGVKLASSYTDQETIKRARAQWMDLINRRAEIREQMAAMPPPRVPRNRAQRRNQPRPGTVCSYCGYVFQ